MYKYIDADYYTSVLSSDPLWYLKLQDFLREHFFEFKTTAGKSTEWLAESEEFLQLATTLLRERKVALSKFGYRLDKPRQPIDTIIIHHSSREAEEDIEYLEQALTLIRIYAKSFSDKTKRLYGKPISSDHFYEGKMTFMPYHYFIWPDGKYIQYLQDEYIGWHAGNWDYNCRSIGIALHDDLLDKEPTTAALQSAREIIAKYKPIQILGHREVSNTSCPGNLFLGDNGWKQQLLPQN